MKEDSHLYAVIMAGGKGTRFWPLSRENRPKQLLAITGSEAMLRSTVDRILPLVPPERVLIVTGAPHADEVEALLSDLPPGNIIIEPIGRNTLPCIGLAAHVVCQKDPDGVMLVLPADHVITKTAQFRALVEIGADLACQPEALVTLGILPTRLETGYGYIEFAEEVMEVNGTKVHEVASFHEKPNQEKATEYLASGRFYWNSGMFIFQARTILSWLDRLWPDMARHLKTLARTLGQPDFAATIAEIYPGLTSISIDHGIMEKATGVLALPADIGWSDVGSWTVAAEHWPEEAGNTVWCEGLFIESSGCVIYSPGKLVALIGVKDLVVIDTPDALLICPKDKDQQVKKAVEALKRKGRHDLL
ncbi:MAG: mannose-1-phosphate guanylyltransferase [Deltaproteobacteria bacterium]|nr:mannose-1-phosphate guanylyltransferase [Deltaproteobacteria bacterium]MBW2084981.1 mannose-1-phosphate guanylyltransferase [Deltaproteobacteria bacterium]